MEKHTLVDVRGRSRGLHKKDKVEVLEKDELIASLACEGNKIEFA